jgi:hypothetical protein
MANTATKVAATLARATASTRPLLEGLAAGSVFAGLDLPWTEAWAVDELGSLVAVCSLAGSGSLGATGGAVASGWGLVGAAGGAVAVGSGLVGAAGAAASLATLEEANRAVAVGPGFVGADVAAVAAGVVSA